jgi:hypothetical protein
MAHSGHPDPRTPPATAIPWAGGTGIPVHHGLLPDRSGDGSREDELLYDAEGRAYLRLPQLDRTTDQRRRWANHESIARIPDWLLHPGQRSRLLYLADAGADVFCKQPNPQHPSEWYLILWGTPARLIPAYWPAEEGDFTGRIEDYQPRDRGDDGATRPVPSGGLRLSGRPR